MSADLQPMVVARGSLAGHAEAAGAEAIEAVRAAAGPVRGARVLHLSGAHGGRVPDLLSALLPLAVDAGLEVEWRVLFGGPELQLVAQALEDGFQGAETAVDDAAWDAYLEACARVAEGLVDGWDAVVLHDPALLGLAAALDQRVVWRCHLDASEPDPPLFERAELLADRLCGDRRAGRLVRAAEPARLAATPLAAGHRPAQPSQPRSGRGAARAHASARSGWTSTCRSSSS